MENNYYIDLKSISLSDYEKELDQTELLPSRKIIQEDIKNRFSCLRQNGIKNLNDLLTALKTPEKIKVFSIQTGLKEEYLTVLKREIASSHPKPVRLADFPGISKTSIQKLESLNIKNTLQLFDLVQTKEDRLNLSRNTGIPYPEILELTKLTDVVRIKWVGANFARLLVDSPFDTLEKTAGADYTEIYPQLKKINEEKKYFKGMFGLNDMKLCIIAAEKVPQVIAY